MFDLNNLSAEERLDKIIECKRIIVNTDAEMRTLQAEADDVNKKLEACIQKRDNAKIELSAIKETIEAMPTNKYKDMLKQHYVNGETWERVAEKICYSPGQIFKFRPLAIKEFDDKWNEKMK